MLVGLILRAPETVRIAKVLLANKAGDESDCCLALDGF